MPVLLVRGFPREDNAYKQKILCKLYIRKSGVTEFFLEKVKNCPGSEMMKQATIRLRTQDDVIKVREFLSHKPYWKDNLKHFIQVVDSEQNNAKKKKDRSRSPLYQGKSEIDMEIEILRKKRQVIEEKKKIIAETERLEKMKGFGSGTSKAVQNFQVPKEEDMKIYIPLGGRKIEVPLFVLPCKLVMRSMNKFIRKKANNKVEKTLVSKIIHARLRRTFALALEHCDYIPGNEIVDLFREQHPVEDDEDFVRNVLRDFRTCHWPNKHKERKLRNKEVRRENRERENAKKEAEKKEELATDDKDGGDGAKLSGEEKTTTDVVEPKPSNIAEESTSSSAVGPESSEGVEQAKSSDIKEESKSPNKLEQSEPLDVIEQSKATDVVEQSKSDIMEHSTSTDVVEPTKSDVVELSKSAVVVEQPKSDAVEQSKSSYVTEVATSDAVSQVNDVVDPAQQAALEDGDWVVDGVDWNDDDEDGDEFKNEQ